MVNEAEEVNVLERKGLTIATLEKLEEATLIWFTQKSSESIPISGGQFSLGKLLKSET